ncbi:MAG TPA: DUF3105 domain-containing protein [Conexibacter sp.]|nr:DUF3105 domain-containing protein [Conexibacter sp.]
MRPVPPEQPPSHKRLRRLGVGLLAVAIGLAGVVLLVVFFQGHDSSQVHHDSATISGPGLVLPADGGAIVAPGATRADGMRLSGAALQHSLALGNVVLLYGSARPPAALRAVARRVAGAFSPALEASGQAVVLGRRPGVGGAIALAWRHELSVRDARDPALAQFVDFWLGRGAGG